MATEKFQSLDAHGIINTNSVSWNLAAEPLYEATIRCNHGKLLFDKGSFLKEWAMIRSLPLVYFRILAEEA